MSHPAFQTPAWYQAITLTERIASLPHGPAPVLKLHSDTDLTGKRFQRWRSQAPFTVDSSFTQRLAIDGISEPIFRHLLGEPVEAIQQRLAQPPDWLTTLESAYACHPATNTPLPQLLAIAGKLGGFLYLVEPLIVQTHEHLHQQLQKLIQAHTNLPFDPLTIEDLLLAQLPWKLLPILCRTLTLELQVARLQGLLSGDTSEQRFGSFVQRLRQRDTALDLLREYPVLARQVITSLDQWADVSLEFLQHLCTDWAAIRTTFHAESDPGLLIEIQGGAGDSHRQGRAVLIATFSLGLKLVYKPRSLSVDRHFQQLLTWLNQNGYQPPLRTLTLLDRGSHGWIEFLSHQPCTTPAEIHRFYQRQGGYLALLYALEATDFHFENLIAVGEQPILIDLEALFHPHIARLGQTPLQALAQHALTYSVLKVGLLPERNILNPTDGIVDPSGLGARDGQPTATRQPYLEDPGTDHMYFARRTGRMDGSQHRPTIAGTDVNPLDYADAITDGFTAMYRLLLNHRDALLADTGPLARFADDEVRVILRHTRTYSLILLESLHPDFLRNALDRDRLFDRLWLGAEHFPQLVNVIHAEREDLWRGDIPMFTARPNSRDLWSSSGQPIADFCEQPGLVLVRRRVRALSEDDLARQLWVTQAALTTLSIGTAGAEWPTYPMIAPQRMADRHDLLATACAVGDRLATLALRDNHAVAWLGLQIARDDRWTLLPTGIALADGLPGIALFLAYLGVLTREERYTILARDAIDTIRGQITREPALVSSIGGFDGWGGLIYTLTHLSVLWGEPALIAEAEAAVAQLPSLIESDPYLDIMSGAAGCIGALIGLHRCAPSERTRAVAVQCGDHLLSCAQPMAQGIGWISRIAPTHALAGFSHGVAGIAWALLELAVLTGEERFRTAAQAAITYERTLFVPDAGNWRDLRALAYGNANQDTFMTAWCHGASGIGLARLRMLNHLDNAQIRAEAAIAVETTLAHGFGLNHSLCHGDLGNIELLVQARDILDASKWRTETARLTAMILESIQRHGWLCGVPLNVETPGLMTGLAGIGYGLLRLAEPTRVPSILTLDSPCLHECIAGARV